MNTSKDSLYIGRVKDTDLVVEGILEGEEFQGKLKVTHIYEIAPGTLRRYTGFTAVNGNRVCVNDLIHFKDRLCRVLLQNGEYITDLEDIDERSLSLTEAMEQFGPILSVEGNELPITTPLECIKPGQSFSYLDRTWIVLEHKESGVTFVVAKDSTPPVAFDDISSNWYTSKLRRYLNQGFLDQVLKLSLSQGEQDVPVRESILHANGFVPFRSTLTTDDGCKGYGSPIDYAAPLAASYYRRYRSFLPTYDFRGWLLTAQTATDANNYVGCISDTGIINYVSCSLTNPVHVMFCLKSDTEVILEKS